MHDVQVTESDAKDVVDLLQESLLDISTNINGQVLFTGNRQNPGKGGVMSKSKQVCIFDIHILI